jgi:hypothetical protein
MTTQTNAAKARPASGNEAPSGPLPPSATQTQSGTRASGPIPSLPLPGLPFSVDRKKLLWWGGLAALATVGVIEWPVAAVVGAGSYVAERWARDDARRAAQQRS